MLCTQITCPDLGLTNSHYIFMVLDNLWPLLAAGLPCCRRGSQRPRIPHFSQGPPLELSLHWAGMEGAAGGRRQIQTELRITIEDGGYGQEFCSYMAPSSHLAEPVIHRDP